MKIFFTGGSGFVASEIVNLLLKKKHIVTVYDLKKPKIKHKNLKYVKGNILNIDLLKKQISKNEIVYHFAAMSDIDDCLDKPLETVKYNIFSTVALLSLCSTFKIKRFVFASTIYVHSDQGGYYKVSKKSAESYIYEFYKKNKLNFTILRYGTIYGPSDNLKNNINKISSIAVKRGVVKYEGSSKVRRKIIHCKDAAIAAVDILREKYKNKSVLITGKRKVKIANILLQIASILKINKNNIYFENKKIDGHYISNPFNEKKIININYKFKNQISLKNGIKEVVNYIKKKN